MTDANLARWVLASVGKHFTNSMGGVHLHIDGSVDQTDSKSRWLELHVLGPDYTQYNRLWKRSYVEILVGCVSKVQLTDSHDMARLKGLAQSILDQEIPVNKLGSTNPPDTRAYLGCLRLRTDLPRAVDGMDFGVVAHKNVPVRRVTVEGHFELHLL